MSLKKSITNTIKIETTETIWFPVVNYEGCYEVSNRLQVRSLNRTLPTSKGVLRNYCGKILTTRTKFNSPTVTLSKGGVRKSRSIYKLFFESYNYFTNKAS